MNESFSREKKHEDTSLCVIFCCGCEIEWTALKNTAVSYKLMTTYRTFVIVQLNNGRHDWRVTLTQSNSNMYFVLFACCQLKKHAQKSEDTLRKIDKEYQDSCRNAEVARLDWEGTVSKVRKKLVSALWFQLVVAVFLRLIMSCVFRLLCSYRWSKRNELNTCRSTLSATSHTCRHFRPDSVRYKRSDHCKSIWLC